MTRQAWRILLAAGALGAAWLACKERASRRERAAAAAAAAADLQRWQERLADVRARAAVVARGRKNLESRLARLRAAGSGPGPSGPASEAQQELDLTLDPGMQAIRLKLWRLRMDVKYAAFFHRMGWSAAQIARFEDVISRYSAERFDIESAARIVGLPPSSPEIAGLLKTNDEEQAAAQRGWMGPDAFAQLQDFDRTEQERSVADRLARNLAFTEAPLSEAQTEQVVETLRAARGPADAAGNPGQINWDSAIQQAAAYLSPGQLAEFKSQAAAAQAEALEGHLAAMIRSWEASRLYQN